MAFYEPSQSLLPINPIEHGGGLEVSVLVIAGFLDEADAVGIPGDGLLHISAYPEEKTTSPAEDEASQSR